MSDKYIQEIIDKAVWLATLSAIKGNPVRVFWSPPTKATDDPIGSFWSIDLTERQKEML